MNDLIRGKVAKILNSREVAINIGSHHGVREGMLFDILDLSGKNIIDPDTEENLGSIERPKVRVQVKHIRDNFSIASTFKKNEINIGGKGGGFALLSKAFLPPKWVTKYETLKTADQTWESITEDQSYIKIGDPIIQVFEDNKEKVK